jgi:hypothetical protein
MRLSNKGIVEGEIGICRWEMDLQHLTNLINSCWVRLSCSSNSIKLCKSRVTYRKVEVNREWSEETMEVLSKNKDLWIKIKNHWSNMVIIRLVITRTISTKVWTWVQRSK